jgi:hypothetical protein
MVTGATAVEKRRGKRQNAKERNVYGLIHHDLIVSSGVNPASALELYDIIWGIVNDITDCMGNKFSIRGTRTLNWTLVSLDGQNVGELTFSEPKKNILVLEYIEIYDDSDPQHSSLVESPSIKPSKQPKHFREKDLGTDLLKEFISFAKGKGTSSIYLSITKEHLKKSPFLADWYRKYGFQDCPRQVFLIGYAEMFMCLKLAMES